MPSAFTVSSSPITTSGTIAVTGAGLTSQYVRGDGTLATFPTSTGGGSSFNYYLNGSISQGTFGGVTYYQMSRTPIFGAGTNFTRTNGAGNGYIASFITNAGDPSQLNIPGGNWNVEFYFNASSGGGSPSFYAELYKVDVTNAFTLIASDSLNPEGITNGTTVDQYFTSIPVPQTTLLITDRLAVRIFVNTGGRTITLHTENSNLSEVLTTFSTGLTALNGLTSQVQYLAVGTSGTDFNISSATDTHTFNLPTASATNRGALSSSDWSAFNGKFTLPSLTAGSVLFSNGTTIAQDNANFFWDDTNNRLGLGTTSPSSRLHVNGSMHLQNSATSVESITFSNGQQIEANGPSSYFKSGNVFTNTTTSNVGIGTSTPSYRLNLYGTTALYNIGTNAALSANNNYFIGHGLNDSTPANITSKIGFISDASVGSFSDAIAFYTSPTAFLISPSDSSNERMRITNSGNVGIGTASPNASAILDLTSTTQGLLIPRMTTTQRNAIASPSTGLIVYDTTLLSLYQYNGTAWAAVGGGGGGSTPVKLTSQTLAVGSWTLVGSYYIYAFSNVNVTTTCDVSVTPQNASYLTAYNAQVLPFVGVAAGVATFYSQFPPQDNMVVDIVITQTI